MTDRSGVVAWLEHHQPALYLAAIAVGALLGAVIPGTGALEIGITPAIAALLFVTFLGVPFTRLGAAFRDIRFLGTLLLLNFLVVPAVVFGLSHFVAHDAALLIGVLLVLLTPCIDYVIVFSALAGAAHEKLLAAAPLLMLVQLALLPLYLLAFAGPTTLGVIEPGPFVEAFLLLIALPLALAAIVQWAAPQARAARAVTTAGGTAMVPLMVLVLVVVVASQAHRVIADTSALVVLIPIYAAFLVVMAVVGTLAARAARLDTGSARALVFSGATRNSLVVLPLALALPQPLALAAAVVVTQTLVELVGMVVFVRVIPRVIPVRSADRGHRSS